MITLKDFVNGAGFLNTCDFRDAFSFFVFSFVFPSFEGATNKQTSPF